VTPVRHLAVASLLTVSLAPALTAQNDGLERCDKPVGALAVVEPDAKTLASLRRYDLDSPTTLIRMYAQKSNCFQVVERGTGLQTMQTERQLAQSGDLAQGSNVGGGQMKAADFYLTPTVLFSEGDAGGVGGFVGGALSKKSGGVVGGGVKFKEAQTTLLLGDVRSGIQVASAQGKAKKADLALGGAGIIGGAAAVGLGGYTKTNEGKVIASSFLNNFNKIVVDVRNDPSLANRSNIKAGAVFNEGDVVTPKIDNVKVYASASDKSAVVITAKKGQELLYLGEEEGSYLHVQAGDGEGWVKKVLVQKQKS
jgi:curli biogenesis system outer membrane secretion channel CsgG